LPTSRGVRNVGAMRNRVARLLVLAVAVALAACGSSSGRAGAVSAACHSRGSRTLAAGSAARVYALGGSVYGCSERTGRRTHLGQSRTCIGTPRVGPVAVAGDLAAYALQRCGIDTGRAQMIVRRLTDGRQLISAPAFTGALAPESYTAVDSIVLRADGAVAWIAGGSSVVRPTRNREVHRWQHAGPSRLDASVRIAPASLRLHGSSQVSWTDSGAVRTATLR
jgi:hypothetical protein